MSCPWKVYVHEWISENKDEDKEKFVYANKTSLNDGEDIAHGDD